MKRALRAILIIASMPACAMDVPIHLNKLLFKAVISGKLEQAKELLAQRADIEGNGLIGTPLFTAISLGHSDIVQYLIENGANLNPSDQNCRFGLDITLKNPVLSAVKANHFDTAQIILTTIPKAGIEMLYGIRTGLMAINRCVPAPPRDIRKKIAQLIIPPLIEAHLKSTNQMLTRALIRLKPLRAYFPIITNQQLDNSMKIAHIQLLQTSEFQQNIRKEVELNTQRTMFPKPEENKQSVKTLLPTNDQDEVIQAFEELKKKESTRVKIEEVD